MLGMFLAALDQTIVSTSIRTIADDLHRLDLQAWATTAYLITATISTPIYGKLSDLFGRKPLFLTAISVFLVGSLLCTISTSMYELAAFRAIQGLGAGGLMSLALAILGDIVAPRERARYQGYFLAVFGTSSVIGPLIGGAFAGAGTILGIEGWRWVFLVNIPIGLVALVVVTKVLNIPHTKRPARIDWLGAVGLVVAIVPLLLVAQQGREWGWSSASSLSCLAIAVVGLVAFVLVERAAGDDALLPMRLFRNPTFSLTSIAGVVVGMGMFGGIALLPQYLQIVRGATPTESGLLMLPLVLGLMIGSVFSGQLTSRTGRYKIFPVVGTALMVVAMVLMFSRVGADSALWEVDLYMLLFGLGVGNCMQTLTLAVQNAAPARDMGVTTSSSTMFRQLGGTLGTAVFLSILFSTLQDKIAGAFAAIAPTAAYQAAATDPAVLANPVNRLATDPAAAGASVLQDSSVLQQMDPRLARPFLVGFSDSMDLVFLVAAGIVAVAFVVLLFLKELPLRTQSGLEARSAELASDGATLDPVGVEAVTTDQGPSTTAVTTRIPRHGPDDVPVTTPIRLPAAALVGPGATGRVLDPRGRVITGATVTLVDGAGAQIDRDRTGGGGVYRVSAREAGGYLAIAVAPGHQPVAWRVTLGPTGARQDVVLPESVPVEV